jgi:hypothetical protein
MEVPMKKIIIRALGVALTAIACLVMTSGPASAHTYRDTITKYWVYDYGYVEMNNSHTTIKVCDFYGDGIGVWVEFYYRRDGHFDDIYQTVSDSNGSGYGCGSWTLPSSAYFIGYQGRYGITGEDDSGWNWGNY